MEYRNSSSSQCSSSPLRPPTFRGSHCRRATPPKASPARTSTFKIRAKPLTTSTRHPSCCTTTTSRTPSKLICRLRSSPCTRTSCTLMGVPSSSCAANRRRRPSKPRRALSLACPSPSSRRPRLQCARSQSQTQRSSSNTCISRSWRKTWPQPHSSRTL